MAQEHITPECCIGCDYHWPKHFKLIGRECAAFGNCSGVKENRCGLRCPPIPYRGPIYYIEGTLIREPKTQAEIDEETNNQ